MRTVSKTTFSTSAWGANVPKIARGPLKDGTEHATLSDSIHSVNDEEVRIFTEYINDHCKATPEAAEKLPIDPNSRDLFEAAKDGWILAALIGDARPDLVDFSKMHVGKSLNAWQLAENANITIEAAQAIGVVVVNIGAQDITGGSQHLILGIIWQIIRGVLSTNLYVVREPRLIKLRPVNESFESLLRVTPETSLLRWVNHHLKESKSRIRTVKNFGKDLKASQFGCHRLHLSTRISHSFMNAGRLCDHRSSQAAL
ncbi:calponin homology domain-containing protein [Powellomyces hirtus]|nr:calponin homology domain-containing protein [Powellomyces hirtus]